MSLFEDKTNANELIFEDLELEKSIYDCIQHGRNMTIYSLEDQKTKFGLSKFLNGCMKIRKDNAFKTRV